MTIRATILHLRATAAADYPQFPRRTIPNNEEARGAGRGFTLVELLIVLAVLVMLVMVLAQSAAYIRTQGAKRFTQAVIDRTGEALNAYHQTTGQWPLDRFGPDWIQGDHNHRPGTEGIESMVVALEGDAFWSQLRYRRAHGNTDLDSDRLGNGRPLYELLDGWGRPLLYYQGYGASTDPADNQPGNDLPRFLDLTDEQMNGLNASLKRRWIQEGRRPLIVSAGPNGLFDTADDINLESARWTTTAPDED